MGNKKSRDKPYFIIAPNNVATPVSIKFNISGKKYIIDENNTVDINPNIINGTMVFVFLHTCLIIACNILNIVETITKNINVTTKYKIYFNPIVRTSFIIVPSSFTNLLNKSIVSNAYIKLNANDIIITNNALILFPVSSFFANSGLADKYNANKITNKNNNTK